VVVTLRDSGIDGSGIETAFVNGQFVVQSNDTLRNIENVRGSIFSDVITGNASDNTLDGRGGADQMSGLGGNDTYVVDNPADVVSEQANQGTDKVKASISVAALAANVENVTLTGTASINANGNDLDNLVQGNSGRNTLDGGVGADEIHGGGDNDALFGGSEDDDLFGDAGSDRLVGSLGADKLTGGSGADIFEFRSAEDSGFKGAAADEILDFSAAEKDKIDLSQIAPNLQFIGNNNAFTGQAGDVRFNAGQLEGDLNGDLVADFRIQVNVGAMAAADLIL